jgi:hypothetical protein
MATRFYTSESKFKAGRPFIMNGEDYNFDDPVDVTGIEPRRIKLMFEANLLEVDERPQEQRKKAPPPPVEGEKHRLKNGGFGRWYIANSAGDNIEGPFTGEDAKKQAELALAKYQ